MGSRSVTVDCECCESVEPNRQCYEVLSYSTQTIGNPGCSTSADLTLNKRFITTMIGASPTANEIKGAVGGDFIVDCSSESSGFCRGRGASGSYPWSNAVYETTQSGESGVFSYKFLFEDCRLGDADLRVIIDVRFIGSCYLPTGVDCDSSCKDEELL